MEKLFRLAIGYWFFAVGLFLLMAPWTTLWGRNWFVHRTGPLRGILLTPWARGAVSGIGALFFVTGVRDTLRVAADRRES